MNVVLLNAQDSKVKTAGSAVKATAGKASIVQGYAQTVLRQPQVNFGDLPNLKTIESDINGGIKAAQTHAKTYMDDILPDMILQTTNISNYMNMQNALAIALDPSAPASEAIAQMKVVAEQTEDYQTNANGLVTKLTNLRTDLNTDSSNFSGYVTQLNAAVDGDNGVLHQLDNEVDDINSKIDASIAGAALSGLAIVGGGLMIAVGAVAGFVTAGTSTPLIVAGVVVMGVGIAGAAASGIAIGLLLSQKNKILTQKAQLTAEVKMAKGMSGGFQSLATQAGSAADAAQDMANAWTGLSQDLGNLISALESGQTNVAGMRKLYQGMAKGSVKDVKTDVGIIRTQLAGVDQIVVPNGTNIGDAIVNHFQHAA